MFERPIASTGWLRARLSIAVALLSFLPFATAATARQHEVHEHAEHVHDLLHRLEQGLSALAELERHDAHDIVERIADELRRELEHGRAGEREHAHAGEIAHLEESHQELRAIAARHAAHLAEARAELASVEKEIAVRERDLKVAEKVIEKAHDDLDRAEAQGKEVEVERIAEIIQHYRARLEDGLAHMEVLHDQRNHLVRLCESVEVEFAAMERDLDHAARALAEAERGARIDEVERLRDRPRDGRGAGEARSREREIATKQLDALRMAMKILEETGRRDLAEMVEHAIHARELGLEGRRDREAREIRESSPKREQIVELLGHAAHLYHEHGMHEAGHELSGLTEELWPQRGERRQPRPGGGDREAMVEQIEIMRMAMHAILETGRKDMAELLERAIRAVEVRMEGVEGKRAREILEMEPELGARVEILQYASQLWRKSGDEEKADVIHSLAERMRSQHDRARRDRPRDERPERRARDRDRDTSGRDVAREQIETMKIAMAALGEAGAFDAAALVQRSLQAHVVRLEGLEGEEARIVREREPELGQLVEALRRAARHCREIEEPKMAEPIEKLIKRLAAKLERARPRPRGADARDPEEQRMDRLRDRIEKLERQLERFQTQLRELEGEGR